MPDLTLESTCHFQSILTRDLNKAKKQRKTIQWKMRNAKGTFHAKTGTIKDRKGMDITEAEDIKMRWQQYIEELCKKGS